MKLKYYLFCTFLCAAVGTFFNIFELSLLSCEGVVVTLYNFHPDQTVIVDVTYSEALWIGLYKGLSLKEMFFSLWGLVLMLQMVESC